MRSNFEAVMAEIFKHEGGYVDHPKDPGGATNMGITFAVLQEWRGEPITKADVKALTKEEARAIYRKKYWTPTRCDDMPSGVDLVMMDGSVNSGIGRGPKWVQAAVGVKQDGKVGPATIAAVQAANPTDTINRACDVRLAFLKGLRTWSTFGKGWEGRVAKVRKKALEMASPSPKPIPVEPLPPRIPEGQKKASNALTALIIGAIVVGTIIFVIIKGQIT